MAPNRLPGDWFMEVLRDSGQFVCQCWRPHLEWLSLWDCYQCSRCGKLVVR